MRGGAATLLLLVLALDGGVEASLPRGLRARARRVAGYARGAGWRGADLETAVAIALRESSGDPGARNYHPGVEDSRGLWQLNVLAHPALASEPLYDPAINAHHAHALWRRAGWRPWWTPAGVAPVFRAAAAAAVRGT